MTQRPSDPRRPTIIDVAELAGVSRQTVSRVLSDHPRVASQTRARVEKVIEELDFRPNRMARALVTKTSLTFGVASVDMRNLHFAETCSGLQTAARVGGYHLVVTELDRDDDDGIGTLETLLTFGVDGIVLFPSMVSGADLESFVKRNGCCLVMIGRGAKIPGVVSIALDEPGAARAILGHLTERGKSRVGLLMNEMFPRFIHTRYEALHRAIEETIGQFTIPVEAARPTIEQGRQAAMRLLAIDDDVDAIVAFNDTMAMGAMKGCHDLGLRIPEDVAIVGYDGIAYGEVTVPPLTTMVQDSFGMAEAAFEAMLTSIKEGSPREGEVQLWPPQLLIRGTT
ncbi:MAG: LacI family DNA-binding transcriptional regulator [Acidimicrobiia bacterium]